MQEKKGYPLYREGSVDIRQDTDTFSSHHIWIGENYFYLEAASLDRIALKTPVNELENAIERYDPKILHSLSTEKITPKDFALILARAKIKELKSELIEKESHLDSLYDRL